MPELPEVETTRRGIAPYICNRHILALSVRNARLRWPIDSNLAQILTGQRVHAVERRAKYLLLRCDRGTLLIHLGMSGRLRVLDDDLPPDKHDHVDIMFDNGGVLRYTDPRRFGAMLWTQDSINDHPLIAHLGPEPLAADFDADYLLACARGRKTSIKNLIMNGSVVVGVGNIYANEALFLAGIHPERPAGSLTAVDMDRLVAAIRQVLNKALEAGGTTLRDFRRSDGKPGYFAQQLHVYGRKDQPCLVCGSAITAIRQSQRASYFCPRCQSRGADCAAK